MQIANTFSLPRAVVLKRLRTLDADIDVILRNVYDDVTNQNKAVIDVFTAVDVTAINNAIQAAITSDETAWLNSLQISKTQIRNAYQTATARLIQIKNAGTLPFTQAGFNNTVSAVEDIANYLDQLIEALKDVLT